MAESKPVQWLQQVLVAECVVSREQMESAEAIHRQSGKDLATILINQGLITQEQIDSLTSTNPSPGNETLHADSNAHFEVIADQVEVVPVPAYEADSATADSNRTVTHDPAAQSATPEETPGPDVILKTRSIGELLVDQGIITQQDLAQALMIQESERPRRKLGVILVDLGLASEKDIIRCLGLQTGFPYLPLESYSINPAVAEMLTSEAANKYSVVPVDLISDTLIVAMANPLDVWDRTRLETLVPDVKISYYVSSPTAVREKIAELYPS
jgi:hypothetical protein